MKAPIVEQKDITNCPTCGSTVRILRRANGYADHYEAENIHLAKIELKTQDQETASKLHELRKGKKTVAFVGMSTTSCGLAPYKDKGVEIWSLNQAHAFPWMKRADRWFQIHTSKLWDKEVVKRDVHGHNDWLRENPWNIPIYMQYWRDDVPNSVAYPLREVCNTFFKNMRRGDAKVKYFTSTIAYMFGVALLEKFERIEIYGTEMAAGTEFGEQKACAEFWIGQALGRGVEIYLPPSCLLMYSDLYGGNEQGEGWLE